MSASARNAWTWTATLAAFLVGLAASLLAGWRGYQLITGPAIAVSPVWWVGVPSGVAVVAWTAAIALGFPHKKVWLVLARSLGIAILAVVGATAIVLALGALLELLRLFTIR